MPAISLTTEQFINRSKIIHRNKYDYKKVKYINGDIKVIIICNIHGEFKQSPASHLQGRGCKECRNDKQKLSKKEFIERSNKIHKYKYNYKDVKYINNKTKVTIICPIHGKFAQKPDSHMRCGCKKCGDITTKNKLKFSTGKFIEKSNKIHKHKYNYKNVKYINSFSKIKIICPIHGEFEQEAHSHLKGIGCSKCGIKKAAKSNSHTKKTFINKAKQIHGTKYIYSQVKYINNHIKVVIICKKHGPFLQTPAVHIHMKCGCPNCMESKGESIIRKFLENNIISYIPQKRFTNCKCIKPLPFDFYLPKYNVCIEYDGIQHFQSIKRFGGKNSLNYTKYHDKIKTKYCKKNNIQLLRITYKDNIEDKLNKYFN